jgi:GlpG protein
MDKKRRPFVTQALILLCIGIFIIQAIEAKRDRSLGLSPIMATLLYDYPASFAANPNSPPALFEGRYWQGIYDILLEPHTAGRGPLFEKIREGQLYRLITPVVLHGGILHILFNMLWLYLLGSQVEVRLGIPRYLLLSLIIGVISNTAQYIASGFLFIGYSGIIAGLAGFIWMRQRRAPWEGYPIPRTTLIVLAIFIVGSALISLFSFTVMKLGILELPAMLANTAHIVGALVGIACGALPFWQKRHS